MFYFLSMKSSCYEEIVAHRFDVVGGRLYRNDFTQRRKGSVPKPADNGTGRGGYRIVTVTINGKAHGILAHRIVAYLTLGRIGPEMEVNHKNGDKLDNRPENLEIVSASENVKHGYDVLKRDKTKNRARGERSQKSRLTENDVRLIRLAATIGETQASLSEQYGVSQVAIHNIIHRRSWKHI